MSAIPFAPCPNKAHDILGCSCTSLMMLLRLSCRCCAPLINPSLHTLFLRHSTTMKSVIFVCSIYTLATTSVALRVNAEKKVRIFGPSKGQEKEMAALSPADEHDKEKAALSPWGRLRFLWSWGARAQEPAEKVSFSYTFDFLCCRKEYKEIKRGSAILDVSPHPGFHSVTIHLNCSVTDVGDFADITQVPIMDAEITNPPIYEEYPRTFVQREERFRSNKDPFNLFKQSAEALVERELTPWSAGEWKCDSVKVLARSFQLKDFSIPLVNEQLKCQPFPSPPVRTRRMTF